MKILISSYVYAPSVGGIETATALLAREFVQSGHTVRIVTHTPGSNRDARVGVAVFRRPTATELWRQTAWADVCFHNNISLQSAWPVLLQRKPWVIAHQTWLRSANGATTWRESLKRWAIRSATNVAISGAIAEHLGVPSATVANPFEADLFADSSESPREKDLVFLGRLVSDKGADLAIEALGLLRESGLEPTLTIVGSGPERECLERQVERLELTEQVHFAGTVTGRPLAELLSHHRVLVVPSRWNEPFGIVALEGLAAGCLVVASRGGGLVEAVGPCGLTVPNGDVSALASALEQLLTDHDTCRRLRERVPAHLERFRPDRVASEYLSIFEDAIS